LGYVYDSLPASAISAAMLARARASLNEAAFAATARVVRRALDAGVALTDVYVDTVGAFGWGVFWFSDLFNSPPPLLLAPTRNTVSNIALTKKTFQFTPHNAKFQATPSGTAKS
jgi:hypothetical protein